MYKFLFLLWVLLMGSLWSPLMAIATDVPIDLDRAIQETKKDVEQATLELNRMRAEITAARVPLVREVRALEEEVAALRRELADMRTLKQNKETILSTLREELSSLEEEVEFISSMASEYRREMGTRLSVAEVQKLAEELEGVDRLLAEGGPAALKGISPLLALVARRNWDNLGGNRFPGFCLDEKGIRHPGTFVLVGPIAYFAAKGGHPAGLVVTRLGSTEPSVVTGLDPADEAQIKALSKGKKASPPLDVTLGDALKIRTARESWLEHIKKGGVVMVPILGIGILCATLVIWKLVSLSSLRTEMGSTLDEVLEMVHQGRIDRAEELARSLGEPLGPVILEGIEHRHAPREHIEEIMHERILGEVPMLERHLAVLAVCAAAAPLLGLLGTVTGMMHTFKLITIFGTGEARLLSSGISEALITTQYGLMVAVPTLLAHAYLSYRVRKIIGTLEQTATKFINGLKLQGGGA